MLGTDYPVIQCYISEEQNLKQEETVLLGRQVQRLLNSSP